jgi:hypothetical protein
MQNTLPTLLASSIKVGEGKLTAPIEAGVSAVMAGVPTAPRTSAATTSSRKRDISW